jgi:type III protein arginine methyltransferase
MMAARALATIGGEGIGNVSACESYLPMGKLTRRVLRANGMENKVKVFHKRSDELKVGLELDSPPDVLVNFSWCKAFIIVLPWTPPLIVKHYHLPVLCR